MYRMNIELACPQEVSIDSRDKGLLQWNPSKVNIIGFVQIKMFKSHNFVPNVYQRLRLKFAKHPL